MTTLAITFLISGVLLGLLSLPLILRKVPMNHVYGVRIEAAFKSEQQWYDINAYGGRVLAFGSLPVVAAGVVGLFLPTEWFLPYATSATVMLLVSVLVPLVLVLRWSRLRGPG